MLSTAFSTTALYCCFSAENFGDKVPTLMDREDRLLFVLIAGGVGVVVGSGVVGGAVGSGVVGGAVGSGVVGGVVGSGVLVTVTFAVFEFILAVPCPVA